MSRHFVKEDTQMAKKHMKTCPTLLVIRQMQIKITMRYTPIRMAKMKKDNTMSWQEGSGK